MADGGISRRKYLTLTSMPPIVCSAGCFNQSSSGSANIIVANLLDSPQKITVEILSDGSQVWKQVIDLPGAKPNEAPSVKTINALQSVDQGTTFRIESTLETENISNTSSFTVECTNVDGITDEVTIRITERNRGEIYIDFRKSGC